MFTGIIENIGKVVDIQNQQTNKTFVIKSPISHELKIDQSVSHNGVCLTVTKVSENQHTVTAILETLRKTNLDTWQIGEIVNLERCMAANGRFDGHIVQGHVDTTAVCTERIDENGSWLFTFEYADSQNITVEKGSITVNGTSLTVVNSQPKQFSVAIIPYTYEHTNFQSIKIGSIVNLEFDIVGKYIQKILTMRSV